MKEENKAASAPCRIAILGAGGLLGRGLSRMLAQSHTVVPLAKAAADVTAPQTLARALEAATADVIINCAGFLNVDRCEKQPRQSYLVNGLGPMYVAQAVSAIPAIRRPTLFHFSSDFVFDGIKGNYNEDDLGRPLSYYGTHKLLADEFMFQSGLRDYYILRTSGLISYDEEKGNFLKRMIALAAEKPFLQIVDDLKISMTTIEALAQLIEQIMRVRPAAGLYNAVCAGTTTWHAILRAAFAQLAIDREIRPVSIDDMPGAALRPRHSDLDTTKLAHALGTPMPGWQEALREHVEKNLERYAVMQTMLAN